MLDKNKPETPLFIKHLDLLKRLGWWAEYEAFLLSYGKDILPNGEFADRLKQAKEKQRIYEKVSTPRPDGKTYIGEDDVVKLTKGPVTLIYHLKDRHLDVANIYRSLLSIINAVKEHLAYEPQDVRVNLHGEQSEIRFLREKDQGTRQLVAGTYDGTIHLRSSVFNASEPQQMAVMIAHEYVHQVVADLSAGRCPRWLDEGIALVLSQDLSDTYKTVLTEALQNDLCFPIDALDSGNLFEADAGPATLAYAQSYSLVTYLCDRIAWQGLYRLLRLLRRTPVEKALQEFSLNYYLLEKEWRRWAKRDN